jgi:phosphatidate cytidylyltransferase
VNSSAVNDATAARATERRGRHAELPRRIAAALPLAAAALAGAYLGGPVFYLLVVAIGLLMAREWLRLTVGRTPSRRRDPVSAGLGLAFLALVALATCWLRGGYEEGRASLFWLLFVVWSTDSGAYLVGRALKGPPLWPRISPKKTWSGALGGLACAVALSIGMGHAVDQAGWLAQPPALGRLAVLGLAVGLLAEAGDLLESWLKRRYGVKDTGSLIPGHGGFLDRLDSFSLAALGLGAAMAAAGAGLLWAP